MKVVSIIAIFVIVGFFIWYIAIKEQEDEDIVVVDRSKTLTAVPSPIPFDPFDTTNVNVVQGARMRENFMSRIDQRTGFARF